MKQFFAMLLLLVALLSGWLGVSVVRTVGVLANPQALTEALPWPWLRDQLVIPKAQEQAQNMALHLPPQEPALWVARSLAHAHKATWQAVVNALLPPAKVGPLLAGTWSLVWEALWHPGTGPREIPLTPWKQQIAQGLDPALRVLLDAMPSCTPQENLALAQAALIHRWDKAPLCRPPNRVLQVFWPTVIHKAQKSVQASLPDVWPIERLLPPDVLANLRRVFVLAPLVGWGLVGLGGLVALWGVALAAEGLAGWLSGIGKVLLVYDAGLFVMARWGLRMMRLWQQQASLSPALKASLEQADVWLRLFWRAVWAPVTPWMWGLLGVGIVLWGGGLLLRAGRSP